ncbi:MAG: hypothetical protein J2P15_19450 [Micromonosporaceae bacterium]|nr:hypothetical protein [Micromonosporaceae bacterium]
MSPRRGDRVAPPPGPDEWDVIFGTNEAGKGWDELCTQATTNTRHAWQLMRTSPDPTPTTSRHHPLKGAYSTGTYRGRRLPQWQIEVTGSGRIWYLIDAERHRVVVMYASPGHPRATD